MSHQVKNQDIQFLRGVAILMVLVQHYPGRLPTPAWLTHLFEFTSFWGGVDLFFAISGFVIAKSLLGDRDSITHTEAKAFWIKRAFRLMPSSWFWLMASLAISPFLLHVPGASPSLLAHSAFASVFAYSNFYWEWCVQHAYIGSICPTPDINGQHWSLSSEEQFYAVLTIALLLTRLRHFLMIALPAAFAIWMIPGIAAWHWHLRFEALAMGVGIFVLTRQDIYARGARAFSSTWVRRVIVAVCLALIVFGKSIGGEYQIVLIAVCSAIATLVATRDGALAWTAIGRVVAWIGERAYSIYLCQWVVYQTMREALIRSGVRFDWTHWKAFCAVAPVAFLLTILVGAISHRIIDVPTTALGKRLARRYEMKAANAANYGQSQLPR